MADPKKVPREKLTTQPVGRPRPVRDMRIGPMPKGILTTQPTGKGRPVKDVRIGPMPGEGIGRLLGPPPDGAAKAKAAKHEAAVAQRSKDMAGIAKRARAKGLHPSAAAVKATYRRTHPRPKGKAPGKPKV